jgi:hypothetical protein
VRRRSARTAAVGGAALALAAALTFAGCSSTSLSAAEVRVPVLLGPVPCIGCVAEARQSAPMPLARVAGRRRFYAFFLPVLPFGFADDNQLGISADRLLGWTPCLDDLQLSNVSAHSWQVTVPFLAYVYDVFVAADATEVIVPGASCPLP